MRIAHISNTLIGSSGTTTQTKEGIARGVLNVFDVACQSTKTDSEGRLEKVILAYTVSDALNEWKPYGQSTIRCLFGVY